MLVDGGKGDVIAGRRKIRKANEMTSTDFKVNVRTYLLKLVNAVTKLGGDTSVMERSASALEGAGAFLLDDRAVAAMKALSNTFVPLRDALEDIWENLDLLKRMGAVPDAGPLLKLLRETSKKFDGLTKSSSKVVDPTVAKKIHGEYLENVKKIVIVRSSVEEIIKRVKTAVGAG